MKKQSTNNPKKRIFIHAKKEFWLDFEELKQYSGVFWALWYRDVRLRYVQSILGWIWAIFQPLVHIFVMYLVFGVGFQMQTNGIPYPIWVGLGMIFWIFLAQSTQQCANIMIQSRNFTQKIYFPHIWLPLSKIAVLMVDFLVQICVWLLIYLIFFPKISIYLLFFPVVLVWFWLFVVGLGVGVAGFCAKYKDALPLVQMCVQIGFFVSPVAYSVDIIPQKWHFLYYFNPLSTILELLRACFFGGFLWKNEFFISIFTSIVIFLVGIYFIKNQNNDGL